MFFNKLLNFNEFGGSRNLAGDYIGTRFSTSGLITGKRIRAISSKIGHLFLERNHGDTDEKSYQKFYKACLKERHFFVSKTI